MPLRERQMEVILDDEDTVVAFGPKETVDAILRDPFRLSLLMGRESVRSSLVDKKEEGSPR
jgi:predicted methyltransferase